MSESFALQSVVTSIVDNNYVTLVILTAVGYDYILTFANEIEYVWSKPWTRVSTLFVLIRYFGLCAVTIFSLVGSSFIPGPEKVTSDIINERIPMTRVISSRCEILPVVGTWAMLIFIAAADLMMILRVWALYGQSRIILGALLTLYAMEIIPFLTACIVFSTSRERSAIIVRLLDFSFCATAHSSPIWAGVNDSLEFTLAAVMSLLITARFIRDALQMHRLGGPCQVGRYMSLLAREGVLYFLAMLVYQLINVLAFAGNLNTTGWRALLIGIVSDVPVFTLSPRFVLTLRELYAHNDQPCSMGTEFGPMVLSGDGAGGAPIIFADPGWDEEFGRGEEIPMVARVER